MPKVKKWEYAETVSPPFFGHFFFSPLFCFRIFLCTCIHFPSARNIDSRRPVCERVMNEFHRTYINFERIEVLSVHKNPHNVYCNIANRTKNRGLASFFFLKFFFSKCTHTIIRSNFSHSFFFRSVMFSVCACEISFLLATIKSAGTCRHTQSQHPPLLNCTETERKRRAIE